MTESTLTKFFELAERQQQPRSFCPLILYHDNPSEQLVKKLNANKHHDRTAIDRHLEKTNEMLGHNAQLWTEKAIVTATTADLVEFEAEYLDKDIKVSPSTSTTSNISSASSSSGESIATIEHHQYHVTSTPRIVEPSYSTRSSAAHNGHYYTDCSAMITEEEEKKYYATRKQTKPQCTITNHTPSATSNDAIKKRRRGNLPKEVTEFLRKWLIQHKKHPYPAEKEKADLARHTGLTVNQISNWFINARRRILQPMLESESLNAQMMAYPELNAPPPPPSSTASSAFVEPPRRRRHDFYTYQREFNATTDSPESMHYHSAHYMEHDNRSDQRVAFRRTRLTESNEHYHQLSMR